ncbi:hypothetical protein HID58_095937 [Brassica napus]|uniref:Transducin/WD40 repeat-like superfamily protein n=1 Tax=Brassica napus TaxID=3708 RepID=A0ABQ7X1Z5_BRANA|nr:hypothetical protein HID58_095937 [Brassica napus]
MVRNKIYEMLQGHVDGSHEDEKEERNEMEISERTEFFHIEAAFLFVAGLDLDIQFFNSGLRDLYYPSMSWILLVSVGIIEWVTEHRRRKGNFCSYGSKETPDNRDMGSLTLYGGTEEMKISKEKKNKKGKSKKEKIKKQVVTHQTRRSSGFGNHYAPEVLLSWSFDQTVCIKDGRQPSHLGFKWSVMTDVETLAWNPHSEHSSVVSIEDGTMKVFDIRAAQSGFRF